VSTKPDLPESARFALPISLYDGVAPRISRDLLVLAIGYRVQSIEKGGLRK